MSVVVVTWVLVLLSVFGLNYTTDALSESRSVAYELERHQLRALARSGVELTMVTLAETPLIDCAALVSWGAENPLAGSHGCGRGRFAVGRVLELGGFEQWVPGIGDEGARLPVLRADSLALAMVPGMSTQGVETLLQARRTAGDHRLPPFGLLGLDETSLDAARAHLTRYGSAVNLNTASAEILRAVGLPASAVEKLLAWRAGRDRIMGTGDDQRFHGLETDNRDLRACHLNSEEAAVLAFLAASDRLSVTSRHYSLAAYGWGDGLSGICEVRAVLEKLDDDSVRIIEWSEHWLN